MDLRVTITTTLGLICGYLCYMLASSDGKLPFPIAAQIISSRTVMGFAIGICRFSFVHWTLRGLVLGAIFTLPLAFSGMMASTPEFGELTMFVMTIVMGMIYGLVIELVSSFFPKSKIKSH